MMRTLPILFLAMGCATPSAVLDLPPLPSSDNPVPPADATLDISVAPVLISGATILTAAGTRIETGDILLQDGRIAAISEEKLTAPEGATVIDGTRMFATPGLIDTHSHIGVFPQPYVAAHRDGNEMTNPVTAELWVEHSFWPQDPGLWRAITGGITTIQALPGSANLIGGRSFTAKLKPHPSARLMRFPGAPQGLKMACGENPKSIYGEQGAAPSTRMGNVAGVRVVLQQAIEYQRGWQEYARSRARWDAGAGDTEDPPLPPARDLNLETLVRVLEGKIYPQMHCYRADEMHLMLDLAKEYGFSIRAFHHALEAYKLADRLAEEEVAISTWTDWWGYKLEAFDGVPQNAAMVTTAGGRATMHSDSPNEVRHLNQEAAKAMAAGRQVGLEISEDQALRWVTANPAWVLGIEDQTGTLEVGKMADVVLWNRHPFSVYALAQMVFIDGELIFDRKNPHSPRRSDFELGQVPGVQP